MGLEGQQSPMSGGQEASGSQESGYSQGPERGGEESGQAQPQHDYANEYYKRLEGLTRKEREMIEQRKRWQAQEQGYGKRVQELEDRLKRYEGIDIERDPESLLRAYDLTVDKYSQMLMNNDGRSVDRSHVNKVEDELKRVMKEFEEYKAQQSEERDRHTYDRFHSEAKYFVEQNADKYPLLSEEPDCDNLIFKTVENHWKRTGEYLPFDVACEYLDKSLANQAMGWVQSEKRRKALGIDFTRQNEGEEENQQRPSYSEPPRTISSKYSNLSTPPQTKRSYTSEERHESIKRGLFNR